LRKRLQEQANARPTVNDVAKAAGVSTATVSRVLNASADVSDALKIKVNQTMVDLGYVRDATARALATRRSFRLGIILPSRMGSIVSEILAAFENSCNINGFGTFVVRSTWERADIQSSFRRHLEHGVEGVFAAGPLDDADFVSLSTGREVALVSLVDVEMKRAIFAGGAGSKSETQETASDGFATPGTIEFALCGAAHRLTILLTGMGHRRIAIVTEPHTESPYCAGLAQGVGLGLADGGFSGPLIIEASGTVEAGAHIFSTLMDQPAPPTAILCATDAVAMGMYFEASRRGLSIPGDISVAALTSPSTARAMTPALSGIDLDPAEIGRLAGENLMARIEERPVAEYVRLHAGLTLRDSLGPPKQD